MGLPRALEAACIWVVAHLRLSAEALWRRWMFEIQMVEDALNIVRRGDERHDPHRTAVLRAKQRVRFPDPLHQLRSTKSGLLLVLEVVLWLGFAFSKLLRFTRASSDIMAQFARITVNAIVECGLFLAVWNLHHHPRRMAAPSKSKTSRTTSSA